MYRLHTLGGLSLRDSSGSPVLRGYGKEYLQCGDKWVGTCSSARTRSGSIPKS